MTHEAQTWYGLFPIGRKAHPDEMERIREQNRHFSSRFIPGGGGLAADLGFAAAIEGAQLLFTPAPVEADGTHYATSILTVPVPGIASTSAEGPNPLPFLVLLALLALVVVIV